MIAVGVCTQLLVYSMCIAVGVCTQLLVYSMYIAVGMMLHFIFSIRTQCLITGGHLVGPLKT